MCAGRCIRDRTWRSRSSSPALAARLGDLHIDAIYSSPLERCKETAAPLAQRFGLTPVIVPDLQEVSIGKIRPLPTDDKELAALSQALRQRLVDIVRIGAATGSWDSIEGSESSKAFRQRTVNALVIYPHEHAIPTT